MENKDKINIPDLSKSSNSAEKGKSIKPRHKTQGKGGNTSVVEMEIYTNHTSNDIKTDIFTTGPGIKNKFLTSREIYLEYYAITKYGADEEKCSFKERRAGLMVTMEPSAINQDTATVFELRKYEIGCKVWRADHKKLLNDLAKLYAVLWNQYDPVMKR